MEDGQDKRQIINGKNINLGSNYGNIGDTYKGIQQRVFSEEDLANILYEVIKFQDTHGHLINRDHISIATPNDKESFNLSNQVKHKLESLGYKTEPVSVMTWGNINSNYSISNAPDNSAMIEIYPANNV